MSGAEHSQFQEILDEIEAALDAEEDLEERSRTRMVVRGVRKVPLDSRISC